MIQSNQGQVMLLTVLVLSATTIAVATIAGSLTLNQIRQATNVTDSAKAIFAAETGLEWERYKSARDPSYPKPTFQNISDFTIVSPSAGVIRSIGMAGGLQADRVTRALEMFSITPP